MPPTSLALVRVGMLSNRFLVLFLAPFIGSFLGVLIERLPNGRPVIFARSACERCGHRLAPRDLVPLLSYLIAHGRCRYCQARIGAFPLAIELAALAAALWAVFASSPETLAITCALGWTLLCLAWIDVRTMLLPDALTLPLMVGGLAATAFTNAEALMDHTLAAILGWGGLTAAAHLYRLLRGREGLGLGDAKLLGASGAFLGLDLLPMTVFLAACLGLAAGGAAAVLGRRMTLTTAMPFGPYLALATWLLWLYGDWLGTGLTFE